MNQTTKRSSSGSARLGRASGFPFARGPLFAPEGDAGGAAGGSSGGDGTSTSTTTSAGATTTNGDTGTAPGGNGEKLIPQTQVNAIVAQRVREAKEAAQREFQAQQAQTQQPKKSEAPRSADDRLAALEAELEATKKRGVFDKHAAKLGLDDEQANDLFDLSQTQRPQDVGSWLKTKVERLGIKSPAPAASTNTQTATTAVGATTTTTPVTAPSETTASPPAAPNAPVKVDPFTNGGLVDIFHLNEQQLNQLGPSGLRREFEKILDIGRSQAGAPMRPKLPGR